MPTLLHHLISQRALIAPNDEALIHKNETLNYQQLNNELINKANVFIEQGIKRSDRIATYLPKRIEAVISLFAASAAGASFVPVNPILKADQLAYILSDCDVRLLVTSKSRLKQIEPVLALCKNLHTIMIIDSKEAITLDKHPNIKILVWSTIDSEQADFPAIQTIDQDLAAILYTSGSTGQPKGVMLSHHNMIAGAHSVTQYLQNTQQDRILAVLPLSFDYGLSQLTTAFSVGASVILMDYLLPRDVIRAVVKYQISGLAAVPPLWIQLSQFDWPEEAGNSLRYFTNSGGSLPVETLKTLRQALPHSQPFLMYGLTEAFRSTYVPPDMLDKHQNSIGIAIPNAEVLVLREDGSECADNEPGELVHRGALVAMGYWHAAEKTAEIFKPIIAQLSGAVLTELAVWSGDTVRRDKDGFMYFISRKDDLIKTSGYRVSPNEVEEVMYQSGLVREAIALGIAHPLLGQAIVLIAIVKEQSITSKELLSYCKQKLPNYMHPTEIICKENLLRNQNGKIDRQLLYLEYKHLFTS